MAWLMDSPGEHVKPCSSAFPLPHELDLSLFQDMTVMFFMIIQFRSSAALWAFGLFLFSLRYSPDGFDFPQNKTERNCPEKGRRDCRGSKYERYRDEDRREGLFEKSIWKRLFNKKRKQLLRKETEEIIEKRTIGIVRT
jgi:hypothetical protein